MGSPVVVIGTDVASYFFPSVDPVGRELRVNHIPYTVIGIAESQGSAFGVSLDKFIVAPYNSPLKRLTNRHGVIDGIMIQSPDEQSMLAAEDAVRGVMRARRKLMPDSIPDAAWMHSSSVSTVSNRPSLPSWRSLL